MTFCLILLLLLVIFEGAFIGFNLENVCDVWLFKVYEAVPVYVTVLVSFAAGALLALLFIAFGRLAKRRRARDRARAVASAVSSKEKGRRERPSRKERRAAAKALKEKQKEAASSASFPFGGIKAISAEGSAGPDSYGGGFKGNMKEEN